MYLRRGNVSTESLDTHSHGLKLKVRVAAVTRKLVKFMLLVNELDQWVSSTGLLAVETALSLNLCCFDCGEGKCVAYLCRTMRSSLESTQNVYL